MAQIIDGKAIAADIRREVAAEVATLSSAHNVVSLPSTPLPPPPFPFLPPRMRSFLDRGLGSGLDS
jgi:hypothetical protein